MGAGREVVVVVVVEAMSGEYWGGKHLILRFFFVGTKQQLYCPWCSLLKTIKYMAR